MTSLNPKIALFILPALFFSAAANAQMGNQPFSFGNAQGGGMSVGGKQAIINEKALGIAPNTLLRGSGGELLDVQNGPGGSVLTSYSGTTHSIPGYKGVSIQEAHPDMTVGIFNGFFLPTLYSTGYSPYSTSVGTLSGATISTWTSRVTSGGMPLSYLTGNAVDGWTGQVLIMDIVY